MADPSDGSDLALEMSLDSLQTDHDPSKLSDGSRQGSASISKIAGESRSTEMRGSAGFSQLHL